MSDLYQSHETALAACGCAACTPAQGGASLARRRFLGWSVAAGLAGATGLTARRALAQTTISPDEALERLAAGNRRYVAGDLGSLTQNIALMRAHTVEKQEPFAAVLSCADSRVPVEIVFDQSIGQLFVTRVAGNLATAEIIASLEYGAAVLGTRAILVLAHQGCGAVKAAVGGKAVPGQISALYAPLQQAVEQGHHDYEATAKLNAKIQAERLATASPVLADLISKGQLKIASGYYALDTGAVSLL
jgi:carbonic anhydrase